MKKNHKNPNLSASQKGFTLLEVMVALVILSVGLLGMASLTASVIRNNSFSDDYTTSTALAQDKLEGLVNTSFGLIGDGSDTVDADGNAGTKYGRIWDITDNGTTKDIKVTVGWISDIGNYRKIEVFTIRSNQ